MASNGEGLVVTNTPDHLQALNNGLAEKSDTEDKSVHKNSELEPKSTAVSVIQTAPPRINGVSEQNHTDDHDKENQIIEATEDSDQVLSIQPPTEQLPAELLDQEEKVESSSLTTVASLVDQEAAAEEEAAAEKPVPTPAASPAKVTKSSAAADLSADWGEDEEKDTEEESKPAAAAESEEKAAATMVEAAPPKTEEVAKKAAAKTTAVAATPPRKSGRPPKPSTKKVESEEMEEEVEGEESVDAIAKELERTSSALDAAAETPKAKKSAAKTPKSAKAAVPESEELDFDGKAKRKGRPKKKDLDEKVEHVTKLGNNMYFYTGPGGQDSPPPLQSDDEDLDVSDDVRSKKEKEAAAAEASRKSSRPGKGRNPRLEREDEEIDIPKKTPVKPNLNPGWLKEAAKSIPLKGVKTPTSRTKRCGKCEACNTENCGECDNCKDMTKFGGPNKKRKPCVKRTCKNPEEVPKSPEVPATPKTGKGKAAAAATAAASKSAARAESSNEEEEEEEEETTAVPEVRAEKTSRSRVSNASPRPPQASPPRDEELPEFDPAQFTPGYVPKTVKKGDDEYMIVVSGVTDTGLCGKYWGDLNNLPPRRRSKLPEALKAGDSPEPGARRGSVGSTGSSDTPTAAGKRAPKSDVTKSAAKKQITKPEKSSTERSASQSSADESKEAEEPMDEDASSSQQDTSIEDPSIQQEAPNQPDTPTQEDTPNQPKKRGRKRKSEMVAAEPEKKAKSDSEPSALNQETKKEGQTTPLGTPKKKGSLSGGSSKMSPATPRSVAAVSAALAAGVPAGQQRSVSCVADTSTQKEVVVECFAPYDDHRWVNIGKERDGMTPDAVQYARALRPPYHLLSFLRIKGHSTKGMSCTDKNTMVFVVLEGEITVILHTTQFNAKKGDSFYIPPKNYYNLINQKAREAELSLIQFQYDGPLPTVNPAQTQ